MKINERIGNFICDMMDTLGMYVDVFTACVEAGRQHKNFSVKFEDGLIKITAGDVEYYCNPSTGIVLKYVNFKVTGPAAYNLASKCPSLYLN